MHLISKNVFRFDNYFISDYFFALSMDAVVSVLVSVLAKTESFIRFLYRFWPKRKIAISACFGFGRNEKKPFGHTLDTRFSRNYSKSVYSTIHLLEEWWINYLAYERRFIGKIQKTFFSGEGIFGGQNPKNAKKKFQKILLSQIVC